MKRLMLKLGEVLCIVLLVVFIAFISSQDKISNADFNEVAKQVSSACDLEQLQGRDKLEIKRRLSLDASGFDKFVYYSSDSVMDVRELLIVFCEDKQQLKKAEEKITAYVNEKTALFEGYAPRESELLASHTLTIKKGYLLFYVGQEREKVLSAFSKSL